MADEDIRVVTYNTAAGNPRIRTPQETFLALPFYREALAGAARAPILALQEVGPAQARALRARSRDGRCRVLQLRRPGLGNALVIPERYAVLRSRRGYYLWSQLRGSADALRRWLLRGEQPDWRQFGELRMWLEARLRDRVSGNEFTVLNTHLSVDPALKVAQARALVARARAAARRGPVVLAGDLNLPAGHQRGRDREVAALLAGFRDMGTAVPPGRPNIDYVLACGFEPVSSFIWTGSSLQLPGIPNAELLSDHYAEDDVLRFAPGSRRCTVRCGPGAEAASAPLIWDSGDMPVDVRTEIEIERPREEVAEFAADPGNATAWYKNITAVEWETPPPVAVGSRLRFHARFLGRTLDYTYEIREIDPGRRLVMATADGPFPMETTYTWEDARPGATRMRLRNRGEPSGFAAVTAGVMAKAMRRANEADLRRLKALLER